MYQYQATLLRVIDGDTVVLDVDLGHKVHIQQTYRLLGINAPEMKGIDIAKGQAAKEFLYEFLNGCLLEIKTIKDRTDKYGRYLVTILAETAPDEWYDAAQEMLTSGHALKMEM